MRTRRGKATMSGPITRDEIEQAALRYLDRFDASKTRVRQVLKGYIAKRARESEVDVVEAELWIEEVIERFGQSGIVDDARFSSTLAAGLRRRGASRQAIVQKLRSRGVDETIARSALTEVDREGSAGGAAPSALDAEIEAARAFVRRRRLGPFRPAEQRVEHRRRDLGALARAGFSLDVAQRALGGAWGDDQEF